MAARYCGGNGVAENGKAAAAVQHRYAYRRCTLPFAPCTWDNATVAAVKSPRKFLCFFLFPLFSTKVKNNLLELCKYSTLTFYR